LKYFIVNGYHPSPSPPEIACNRIYFGYFDKSVAQKPLREPILDYEPLKSGRKRFLSIKGIGGIWIYAFGKRDASLIIRATGLRNAYLLGNSLKSILTTEWGLPPSGRRLLAFLLELRKAPKPKTKLIDIVSLLKPFYEHQIFEKVLIKAELGSGTGLSHSEIAEACYLLSKALTVPRLLDAFIHLEHSYSLVFGITTNWEYSQYESRRQEMTYYELEKSYLENRIKCDLAFVSAFRGIESILGVANLKKYEIPKYLKKLDKRFHTTFSTSDYHSLHDIFCGGPKRWRFRKRIASFLDLRNSVAAHANPHAPGIVGEDQVLEIQHCLKAMIISMVMGI
jgi:hypothetical protein